jgi:hypothetical protein
VAARRAAWGAPAACLATSCLLVALLLAASLPRTLVAAAAGAQASTRVAGRPAGGGPTALLVFAPVDERLLASLAGMSVGILSASEGDPSAAQLQLDITQGARLPAGAYGSPPPALRLRPQGAGGWISGWARALERARRAPGELRPGLLASALGGAGYVAEAPGASDAPVAADAAGHVAALSLGSSGTLAARARALLRSRSLVVVTIPPGSQGRRALRQLAATRGPGQLMIVVESQSRSRPSPLLWVGAAGLGGRARGELGSSDTRQRGLLSSTDIAPTILAHERVAIPASVQGSPARVEGPLDGGTLRSTLARLRVIGGRRLAALGWLLVAWALLLVCSRTPAARRRALRVGALGVLWTPLAALATAAIAPAAAAEYALLVALCGALGALSDRLASWPRALLAPAACCVAAIAADALAGSQLLMRSLLGPDPALGARFHGIGNDLKSALAVLVLAAVAGWLYPSARDRRAWLTMALAGAVLACVEGATRLGAGVGGVIIVCVSFALAVATLLPDARTRRRAVIVVVSPVVGLLALALVDVLTAHGGVHYSGSVLHAHTAGQVREVIVRRYEAAWRELRHGAMPLATLLALVAGALALRLRPRVLAAVADDPAWRAALYGSLAAGLVGSLVEDSGPVLLVTAVFTGACVLCYLWGRPAAVGADARALMPAGSVPAPGARPPLPAQRPERASAVSADPAPARPSPAGATGAGR